MADGEFLKRSGASIIGAAAGDGFRPVYVVKAADESVTSSLALQDDDHLLIAIGANQTWHFRFVLHYLASATGDLKASVTTPSGATVRFGVQALASGLTAGDTFTDLQAASFAADDSPFNTAASNTTETVMGVIEGVVINGATPGRLTLHWTQLASSATATTILANSFL